MSLSQVVKQIRLDRAITQTELASRLKVTKSYICKIESGSVKHQPSRRFIQRFAQVFGMGEEELLLRSGRLPEGVEAAIAQSILSECQQVQK